MEEKQTFSEWLLGVRNGLPEEVDGMIVCWSWDEIDAQYMQGRAMRALVFTPRWGGTVWGEKVSFTLPELAYRFDFEEDNFSMYTDWLFAWEIEQRMSKLLADFTRLKVHAMEDFS